MLLHKTIARLIAITIVFILLSFPLQPSWGTVYDSKPDNEPIDLDLPVALEDEIFDELPFAQRRQVLREEVERGPRTNRTPDNPRQYNWLIR